MDFEWPAWLDSNASGNILELTGLIISLVSVFIGAGAKRAAEAARDAGANFQRKAQITERWDVVLNSLADLRRFDKGLAPQYLAVLLQRQTGIITRLVHDSIQGKPLIDGQQEKKLSRTTRKVNDEIAKIELYTKRGVAVEGDNLHQLLITLHEGVSAITDTLHAVQKVQEWPLV